MTSLAPPARRNRSLALALAAVTIFMAIMSFVAVPIYASLFGTRTGAAAIAAPPAPSAILARPMTVRFDTNMAPGMEWTVTAPTPLTAKIGTLNTVDFTAHNGAHTPLTGLAVFSVAPATATPYFKQVKCLCAKSHTLEPGETRAMPVQFYVDPAIASDHNLDPLANITLSYTFYASNKGGS